MRALLNRLSYANVMATLAFFLALGSGAVYAAGRIGSHDIARNAITSKQIRNGAVKGKKLARAAVTSTQVRDGSLRGDDFAPGQLPRGERGAEGPAGPIGPVGISGYHVVLLAGAVQPDDTSGSFTADCPPGESVLGGGVATFLRNIHVLSSTPVDDGRSWSVHVEPVTGNVFGGMPASVNVRIVCADVERTK